MGEKCFLCPKSSRFGAREAPEHSGLLLRKACTRKADVGAVDSGSSHRTDGPAQGDQAGERGGARREERGAAARSRRGRSKSYRARSLPHRPPWSSSCASHAEGPPGTEARDQASPRLPLYQPLAKTGQAKPRNVFHLSLRSTALVWALTAPPDSSLQYPPACSFLLSPSHHTGLSMEASGPRVVIHRSF